MLRLLFESEKLLLEDCELILDILNVSAEGTLNFHALTATNLGQPLLDSLSNFLRELQSCHAVFDLDVGRVEVNAKDNFGICREH